MLMVIEGKLSKSTELINYILSLATFLFEHGHFQKKLQIENSIILLQRQFRKDFRHGIIQSKLSKTNYFVFLKGKI